MSDVPRPALADGAAPPSEPVVSVLMLAYNHAPYLVEALESVIGQQTSFPIEVLIGEDCSSDATAEIAAAYECRHPGVVTVITSEANVGMHENHARLVRAARGRYLAYCEGDDFWNSRDKLAEQVAFLESRPDFVAVHSEFSSLAHTRGRWRAIPRYRRHFERAIPQGQVFEALLLWNFIQTCTFVVRTEAVKEYSRTSLAANLYPNPDWSFFLFISKRGKIGFIDEPLATYRRTPGSIMNSGPDARVAIDKSGLRMVRDVCEFFSVPAGVELEALRHAWAKLLVTALEAGDTKTAREAIQWGRDHPPVLFRPARQRLQHLAARHELFSRLYRRALLRSERVSERRAYRTHPACLQDSQDLLEGDRALL